MKIESVRIRTGPIEEGQSIEFGAPKITIFVGPNNSGKSLLLRELQSLLHSGNSSGHKILDAVKMSGVRAECLESVTESLLAKSQAGVPEGQVRTERRGSQNVVSRSSLESALLDPEAHKKFFHPQIFSGLVCKLDSNNRINAVSSSQVNNLYSPPASALHALYMDDARRKDLKDILFKAFGKHALINPTNLGSLFLCFSDETPPDGIERSLSDSSMEFFKTTTAAEALSDGVKSFSGILCEVMSGDHKVIILDEPEAFLHPTLSFMLGEYLSKPDNSSDRSLFCATHSPNFLAGCAYSNEDVNVVRLTFNEGVGTARILPGSELSEMLKNPMLRSVGVLNALFYDFVVVTEGDSDRALYEEINRRLQDADPVRGIRSCLFLNARSKQTVKDIVAPLRRLGIPTVAIVDIDVLKDGGKVWTDWMRSISMPEIEWSSLSSLRSQLKTAMEDSGLEMKRDGGVGILVEQDAEAANNLFERLNQYGLFVVRNGELESWLPHLGADTSKSKWLPEVFEKLGSDSSHPDYVRPAAGDVWDFLDQVANWLNNANRKGIPN